jgi:hypothetical protein
VEIDYDSQTYTVQVDGRVVGKNYTTYYPKDENTFLIYSRDAQKISFPLPTEWFQKASYVIKLFKLTEEGTAGGPSFQINDLTITFDAKANTPYKLSLITGDVTLLTPNGGEIIPSGSNYRIQWGSGGAVKFKLWYSMDNGVTWSPIPRTGDFIPDTGYDWQVPNPRGNKEKCLVRVKGYDDTGNRVGADKSDATFTIEVVKVTWPNGGETATSGDISAITWTTNGTNKDVAKVRLSYTKDGGVSWNLIDTVGGNPGTYLWEVPGVGKKKDRCKVKVELRDESGNILGKDSSDGWFTIQGEP